MKIRHLACVMLVVSRVAFSQADDAGFSGIAVPALVPLASATVNAAERPRGKESVPTEYHHLFYPIGWSKSGALAYVRETYDDGIGARMRVEVVDLVTDAVKFLVDTGEGGIPGASDTSTGENLSDIERFWRENRSEIEAKLHASKILPQEEFVLGSWPYRSENSVIGIHLVESRSKSYERESPVHIWNYPSFDHAEVRVYLMKGDTYAKLISHQRYEQPSPLFRPHKTVAMGFLKSPWENRIAVLLVSNTRGFEGPPDHVRFSILGADLSRGFEEITRENFPNLWMVERR